MAAFVAPPVTAAGQAALASTFLAAHTPQQATFNACVADRIQAQQDADAKRPTTTNRSAR